MQNQDNKNLLRRQITDLQSELVYTRKITNMQFEIDSLKQQISELKDENTRLEGGISKQIQLKTNNNQSRFTFAKASEEFYNSLLNSIENNIQSSDEEYYSADEGTDKIFDRICKYCGKKFKYPSILKRH